MTSGMGLRKAYAGDGARQGWPGGPAGAAWRLTGRADPADALGNFPGDPRRRPARRAGNRPAKRFVRLLKYRIRHGYDRVSTGTIAAGATFGFRGCYAIVK